MSIASTISRILLGVLFVFAGVMVLFMGNQPPQPGLAGTLSTALYQSHWIDAIALVQFASGLLLLVNRYVPFALVMLGAFLYNSLAFHALVVPQTLPVPVVVIALWIVACLPYRPAFAALFTAKAQRDSHKAYSP